MEQDPSNSSLFYLFQEVSNLQLPGHDNFLDSSLLSTWLSKSKTDNLTVTQKENNLSEGCSQQCPKCVMPCQKAIEEGNEDTDLGERGSDCSSPWKVLSLINLQCERLMHDRDGGERSGGKFDNSKSKKTGQIVKSSFDPHHCSNHTQNRCGVHTAAQPEPASSSLDAYSDVVNEMDCNAPHESSPDDNQLTFSSIKARVLVSYGTVDHNDNLVCVTEPPPPLSSPTHCTAEVSPSTHNHKLTPEPKCSPLQMEKNQLSSQDKTFSPGLVKEDTNLPPSSNACSSKSRTKTPRKQTHPTRSVTIEDPDVEGVLFRMDPELDDSKEHCRLLITSKYSKKALKSARRTQRRTRTSLTLKTSSSDEGSDVTNTGTRGKVCASCCTKKTPMWRDADDGTPLCNACGIRYKKYRVRCGNCWHIPRKESNSNSCCLKCGTSVRSQKKQTHT